MRRNKYHGVVSASSCRLPRFNDWDALCIARESREHTRGRRLMDPKLTLLVLLIGAIVGLSHLGRDGAARFRAGFVRRSWRAILRKS